MGNLEHNILEADTLINQRQLDELNQKEGWELINIIQSNGKFYFYFKRPKSNGNVH